MIRCARCGTTIPSTLSQRVYCGDCKQDVIRAVTTYSAQVLLSERDGAKAPPEERTE